MPVAVDVLARLVLSAVFALAAVTKLADRQGTRRAAIDFGAPEPLAAALSRLLPIAELTVAILLLPASTALAGALGALGLLLLFSAAIAFNLSRGRAPDCHCFGQLASAPAGPGTQAGVAALAVAGNLTGSDVSAYGWVGAMDGSGPVLLALAAGAALLAAGATAYLSLLRRYGRALVRLDRAERMLAEAGLAIPETAPAKRVGLEPGTPAPEFDALPEMLAPGLPLLLIFASPGCGACETLLPQVAEWQTQHAGRVTVAIASHADPEQVDAEAAEFGLSRVLVDERQELYRAFEASGTPSALLIAPDGSVASHVASGREPIEALVASVVDARGAPVGAPVPDLELPSLEGESVNLADLTGQETLLLFWSPDCGHCRAMHDQLLAREADADGSSPRLVIVSSGEEAKTRADGFTSTVLLDEYFEAGKELGIRGTPMGVLLGADGRIASGVAAGARAILTLLGDRSDEQMRELAPADLQATRRTSNGGATMAPAPSSKARMRAT
jgi:thiol-disulfide isomerase/thioredoxin